MNSLKHLDKVKMSRFFGFKNGYIFTNMEQNKISYSKTHTRNMIWEACKIDIFSDGEYNLSQEKCIRKIWEEKNDYSIGCLLKVMLDFYLEFFDGGAGQEKQKEYEYLRELEKSLLKEETISLPTAYNGDLLLLKQDIGRNIAQGTPELILDRLHTFAVYFLRELCSKHNIDIKNGQGDYLSLQTLVANLKKIYKDDNYFSSEFPYIAVQNSINCFDKFNDIRNNRSYAHANPILAKIEAEYVVSIISSTLFFIDNIEKATVKHDDSSDLGCSLEENNLPF